MVKIRLTRTGKTHEPHFRIVAVHDRSRRDGDYIEKIGYYNPRTNPPTLQFDKEILQKWMDRGAQMTDTVYDIFVREGIIKQSGARKARISKIIEKSKKEKAAAEAEAKAGEEPKTEAAPKAAAPAEAKPEAKPEVKPEPEKKEETKEESKPAEEKK